MFRKLQWKYTNCSGNDWADSGTTGWYPYELSQWFSLYSWKVSNHHLFWFHLLISCLFWSRSIQVCSYIYGGLNFREKVLACAKHFVGDGGTTKGINENNTISSWKDLLKIHIPPYIDSIYKGVGTVMISYSSWNGKKMHANKDLVTGYLKNALNFQVIITVLSFISDWNLEFKLNTHVINWELILGICHIGFWGSWEDYSILSWKLHLLYFGRDQCGHWHGYASGLARGAQGIPEYFGVLGEKEFHSHEPNRRCSEKNSEDKVHYGSVREPFCRL